MFILAAWDESLLSAFSYRVRMTGIKYYYVVLTPAEYAYIVLKYEPRHFFSNEETKGIYVSQNTYNSGAYFNEGLEYTYTRREFYDIVLEYYNS